MNNHLWIGSEQQLDTVVEEWMRYFDASDTVFCFKSFLVNELKYKAPWHDYCQNSLEELIAMERKIQRILNAAEGYLTLGLFEESWNELESIPIHYQQLPPVLSLRIALYAKMEKWADALDICEIAVDAYPQLGEFHFQKAQLLDQLGKSWEAKHAILAVPQPFQHTDIFHFNLARYETELGNLDSARAHLATAARINPSARLWAHNDPILHKLASES